MKNVPRVIVRNMLPFQPAPTEAEATKMEAERLQQRMEENAIWPPLALAAMVSRFSLSK